MLIQATIVDARRVMQRNRIRKLHANRLTLTFCAKAISIVRTMLNASKVNVSAKMVSSHKDRFAWISMNAARMLEYVVNVLVVSTLLDRIDANAQRKLNQIMGFEDF